MIQLVVDTDQFHLGRLPYRRISLFGLLLFSIFLATALFALVLSVLFWTKYSHDFTLYIKWQDVLVILLGGIAFIASGGSILVLRFLCAIRAGYVTGMLTFMGETSLMVRDLSSENLASIFWMMNSAFWCFAVVLVGLLPLVLIGWTWSLPYPVLAVVATAVVGMLGIAGLVVSVVAAFFLIIGCIGAITFCRKLGSLQKYELSNHAIVCIDNFVLTIIYPGMPEAMVDLDLLDAKDRHRLLFLLQQRWMDAQRVWNPCLDEEIEAALEEGEIHPVLFAHVE